jgi:serine/threonine protein kinase
MNLRSLVASLFGGGGRPKVHVWKRFEPLGEGIAGTMSRFFKVRDSESGQIVGLKLPDTAKLAPIEARFKGLNKPSEGEISSQIKGDHIVVTHEFGRTHDGGQYLVQEFLEGSLVHLRLKRGDPLSLPERIDIIRQAASALAVVHEAGFVHRDICPRNLMLSPKGRVTLFDFGLSVPDAPPFLRHAELHGARGDPPPPVQSPARYFFIRRDGLRNLLRAPALAGRECSGGLGPRHAPPGYQGANRRHSRKPRGGHHGLPAGRARRTPRIVPGFPRSNCSAVTAATLAARARAPTLWDSVGQLCRQQISTRSEPASV